MPEEEDKAKKSSERI